jgi:hypothetical protein
MKMVRTGYYSLALLVLLAFASPAQAACTLPNGAAGEQMYNSSESKMQYCNGSDWIDMSGGDPGVTEPGDQLGNHTATQNLDMNNFKVIDLGTPTDGTDIVTKAYVDSKTGANETDPQVGAVTNNNWCKGDGSAVQCSTTAIGNMSTLFAVQTLPEAAWEGIAVGGAWTPRKISTLQYSAIAGASLANDRITLPAGTYYIDAVLPFMLATSVSTRLIKTSNNATLLTGTSLYTGSNFNDSNINSQSFLRGVFTLSATDSIELQYYISTPNGNIASGIRSQPDITIGLGYEVYTTVFISQADAGVTCTLDGVTSALGGSYTFYSASSNMNCSNISLNRTCQSNGSFSGSASYQYANCATETGPFPTACMLENNKVASGGTNAVVYSSAVAYGAEGIKQATAECNSACDNVDAACCGMTYTYNAPGVLGDEAGWTDVSCRAHMTGCTVGSGTGMAATCPAIDGYFVATTNVFNGNLGGIAGASATCLSQLQGSTWKGKTGTTLNSSTVKAWICDSSTCNQLTANKRYAFSQTGYPSIGGATFVADASGLGPSDSANWNGISHFGSPIGELNLWTNRGAGSSTKWSASRGHTDSCSNWTTSNSSNRANIGSTNNTNTSRWNTGSNIFCSDTNSLVCAVDIP